MRGKKWSRLQDCCSFKRSTCSWRNATDANYVAPILFYVEEAIFSFVNSNSKIDKEEDEKLIQYHKKADYTQRAPLSFEKCIMKTKWVFSSNLNSYLGH